MSEKINLRSYAQSLKTNEKISIRSFAPTIPINAVYLQDNQENMTYWGCRLFDNEADARKSFG
jgi:hypothetical protein